ncbi:Rha family phage regulatory protein [Paenibacillus sp. LBL]|uniref:Rha family transcriptional regulator n=1 Tax=Paenibacillus sp. LBL TaxID=2940563 RepID=UPI0024770481|nr:Rha family transcriptional regulator [Paenibacillus sp. LBL]MDH6670220.1 Rha family phage regulatory protein [Paenibacillus sp. LBL]
MTQLVFIDNGKTVTDSLTVALVFGKEHDKVMRDIRELECSKEFSLANFGESTYTNDRGRTYPKYIITQDGFSFLVMGYTGKEAARFKEKYIAEFNRMRDKVNNLPASPLKALMQATHNLLASQELIVERLDEVEEKVEKQITLNSGEQRRLQKAIAQKIYSIEPDEEFRSELFRQLYKEVKDRWQVPSYKDILRQELQSVLKYVEAWVPIRRAG